MRVAIKQFLGIAPRLDPRRMPDSAAQAAVNCDLRNGVLRALKTTAPVTTLAKPGTHQTIYRFGQTVTDETLYWFHWIDDVDIVKGQIAGDVDERTYFTGDSTFGHPRVTKGSLALAAQPTLNLIVNPTGINQSPWTGSSSGGAAVPTVAANAGNGPDGTLSADRIDFPITTGSQTSSWTQPISGLTNPSNLAPGIWLRADAATTIELRKGNGAAGFDTINVTTNWTFFPSAPGLNLGTTHTFELRQPASQAAKQIYAWGATNVVGLTPLDWRVVQQGYPLASYRLGVPAPASAPTNGGVSGIGDGTDETRVYVYTYVTGDGEESQPSSPLTISNVKDGQTVVLNGLVTAPADYNITSKRIYRTVTTLGSNTDYQFVTQITDATTTYTDNKRAVDLAETIPSIDWAMPPTGLRGLVNLPNGMMAGFLGNDVYLCEPYRPFAWPTKYIQTVDYPIVGLGVFAETLVVLTKGVAYLGFGSDPGSFTVRKLELAESCQSKRGIVNMGFGVAYPSPNGLVLVGPSGPELVTEAWIDKEYWQSLNPASIHAYHYDGRYIGFYNNGSPGAFQFDPQDTNQPFTLITDVNAIAGFNDLVRDALYLNVAGEIREWDQGGTPLTYTWRSRKFEAPYPVNFGWAKVEADTYPVTLRVYAEDENPASGTVGQMILRHTEAVAKRIAFRLPKGFASSTWEVEVTGVNKITGVYLAQGSDELQEV